MCYIQWPLYLVDLSGTMLDRLGRSAQAEMSSALTGKQLFTVKYHPKITTLSL